MYQRELDGVQRVGGEDLVVEARVDHGGLGPVRAHQVHRLRVVLLPPASVLAHQLSCKEYSIVQWRGDLFMPHSDTGPSSRDLQYILLFGIYALDCFS